MDVDLDKISFFREALRRWEVKRGVMRILRRQLEHRFGPFPDWATQKIEEADRATLEE